MEENNEDREFESKAKWFEYGEKPNKIFLKLVKSRQKQNLICKIKNAGSTYKGRKNVMNGIRSFYEDLYESKFCLITGDLQAFYRNCPKLDEEQKKLMDQEITLEELTLALRSCKMSAPGSDGVPYLVYKKLWKISGPILLKSWNHSPVTGKLPISHLESIITLLPKEGKKTKDI